MQIPAFKLRFTNPKPKSGLGGSCRKHVGSGDHISEATNLPRVVSHAASSLYAPPAPSLSFLKMRNDMNRAYKVDTGCQWFSPGSESRGRGGGGASEPGPWRRVVAGGLQQTSGRPGRGALYFGPSRTWIRWGRLLSQFSAAASKGSAFQKKATLVGK